MSRTLVLISVFVSATLTGFAEPAQVSATRTVLDGVYNVEQATRGKGGYDQYCGACHGVNLEGPSAPELVGNRFLERWREDTLDSLFDHIRATMPRGRPRDAAPIPESVYLDLYAYMLQRNDYPAGPRELTIPDLKTVLLIRTDGPKPVPDGATVLVVGCFAEANAGQWIVSRGTEPARSRVVNPPTQAELSASAAKPLGELTFRLRDLEAIPDFDPEALKGKKVHARGFLVRAGNALSLSMMSLDAVAPCM